jgi:hypothetical protein
MSFRAVGRRSLVEARGLGFKTAFLSHSHHDAELVMGCIRLLEGAGWSVYVDWRDGEMPSVTNRDTARRIQQAIDGHDLFLFLATENSMASRWCPWEIGYADAKKQHERIVVIPTSDPQGKSRGSEYLQLYRHVDIDRMGRLQVLEAGGRQTVASAMPWS